MATRSHSKEKYNNIIPLSGRAVRRAFQKNFDSRLILYLLFLIAFGLVMIYSASSYVTMRYGYASNHFLKNQLRAELIGLPFLLFITFFPYRVYNSSFMLFLEYILAAVFPLLVLFMGTESHGAVRWVKIPGTSLSFQPAEASKLLVILFMAGLLVRMKDRLNTWYWILFADFITSPIILIIYKVTKNLSSALIIFMICCFMSFIASRDYKFHMVIALVAVAVVVSVVFFVYQKDISELSSFRLVRIANWLHPETSTDDGAYQTLQALYAIGNGGLFGKGLGQSVQKVTKLPEPHNDMIFAVICEELGLIGAFALMLLFALLLYRIYLIARNTRNKYGFLMISGVLVHFAIQILMNIAVVTAVMPNTGVSLPFISYGGSSAVFLMCEIGLIFAVNRQNNREADA